MQKQLSAVVTGGGRGIGRAIAVRLTGLGYRVVITDLDTDAVALAAQEIGAVAGVAQDVRDPDSHRDVAAIAQEHGQLAVWFNNAGVGDDGTLGELSDERVKAIIEVNLLGAMYGTRAAIAAFGEAGGDVINVASLAGLGPVPGYTVYAASKAGVVSMSMSAQGETPRQVRVHALCPDAVQTAMLDGMNPLSTGPQLVHTAFRILTPEEIANAGVGLIGSRRVVLTVPGYRAAVQRSVSLMPSAAQYLLGPIASYGKFSMKRWQKSRASLPVG